jgi:hypothetical protein
VNVLTFTPTNFVTELRAMEDIEKKGHMNKMLDEFLYSQSALYVYKKSSAI